MRVSTVYVQLHEHAKAPSHSTIATVPWQSPVQGVSTPQASIVYSSIVTRSSAGLIVNTTVAQHNS